MSIRACSVDVSQARMPGITCRTSELQKPRVVFERAEQDLKLDWIQEVCRQRLQTHELRAIRWLVFQSLLNENK